VQLQAAPAVCSARSGFPEALAVPVAEFQEEPSERSAAFQAEHSDFAQNPVVLWRPSVPESV